MGERTCCDHLYEIPLGEGQNPRNYPVPWSQSPLCYPHQPGGFHRAGPRTPRQVVLGPEAEVPFRIVLGTVEMKEELNEHAKPQEGTAATSLPIPAE